MRLRKKLDLIKYEREKVSAWHSVISCSVTNEDAQSIGIYMVYTFFPQQEHTLNVLRTDSKELARRRGHCVFKKKLENPMKKVKNSTQISKTSIRIFGQVANRVVSVRAEDRASGGSTGAHPNDADQGEHRADEVPLGLLRAEGEIGPLRLVAEGPGGRYKAAGERDQALTGKVASGETANDGAKGANEKRFDETFRFDVRSR